MEIFPCLSFFLIQRFAIQGVESIEICYYRNNTQLVTIRCADDCCQTSGTSPESACCTYSTWSSFAVPIFVITGICLIAVCLIYLRPLLKVCFGGFKCPCATRLQVSSSPIPANQNSSYMINNGDLPDYETISKTAPIKDATPPPYNFVTAHPTDFGISGGVPTTPPEYDSRCNSARTRT